MKSNFKISKHKPLFEIPVSTQLREINRCITQGFLRRLLLLTYFLKENHHALFFQQDTLGFLIIRN